MKTDSNHDSRHPLLAALLLALIVAAMNIGLWWWSNLPNGPEDWKGPIGGFALSAFQRYQNPLKNDFPSDDEIDGDLKLLKRYTSRIRTYSTLENPQVYRLAEKEGLQVMAGAWIDRRLDNNEKEVETLIAQARRYPNSINRVVVGNEVLYRNDVPPEQLMAYADRVRAAIHQPVTIAEPIGTWQKYPELAEHVDFITVHLFPYWNGIPVTGQGKGLDAFPAVADVLGSYEALKQMYPGKPIVIGEVGWPSNGDRFKYADPSVSNEAIFLRTWFNVAKRENIDYYVMEAFDQPWKEALSGRTEAYWGMFNADRQQKFPFTGPVTEDVMWPWKALAASLLALLPMIWFASRYSRFKLMGRLFFCALIQLACGLIVWSATLPFNFYLSWIDWTMLVLLFPAQIAILAILLINGFEFTEVLWRRGWVRHAGLLPPDPVEKQPFVSIHLACYNEPPEMVFVTLDSLAELKYENFEVLVIDNNTKDPAIWKPVQEYCEKLGSKFRFFHLEPWPGFKAGALNFGLKETDPRADVVAVIDADYVVREDWLASLTGYFHDPKVAVVQCPQAHRDFEHNRFRRMTAWEYDGFFRIGMHHRNERNAIIQHGTMTMVRRSALEGTGGWSEWTICEDAELGLRLMHAGYELVYVDELMGKGLTPADFKAYKSQRYRWAFGAMQILKGRWDWMTKKGPLSGGQRFHFLTGWFSWFADALHLIFTMMAIFWTAGMVAFPTVFALPMQLFLIPVIGFFFAKAIFGIVLYRARVPCSWYDTLMASLASMSLSHAIARGILHGLTREKTSFVVTAKSRRLGGSNFAAFAPVREELLMAIALVCCIIGMGERFGTHYVEGTLWMFILGAQSIPYVSAVIGAWIAHKAGDKAG
ncbi:MULTISPECIES: glycosyltransferase family 2 protein [unclassified Dyella]|uniref:glycosyltransferase family 2 protein n=1 Tax=unclassified Dyella TaxID=2634549 RepID=UPI000C81C795|nr:MULTISPECIES: glycosyltransferase family 2 protein [unclassified Dyella]MDR3445210.1 glycosyltransferase [Dyella sp.]PMQ07245.1 Cellulose synthase catalytic subunit [UDP-forming] [Dyella sp. AD56]